MRTWRTLIVEDDATVADVHRRLVERTAGFAVVGIAPCAAEARRLLALQRPELVLLDLGLPDGDGGSLLRAMRGGELPVEVIAVTAARDSATVRRIVHLGVVDYLVKPFTPERLHEALIRFRDRIVTLTENTLDQAAVDAVAGTHGVAGALPRELTDDTLARVRRVLAPGAGLRADEVAERLGIARVTARRYLEYLVTVGEVAVESVPAGPGRPRKTYRAVWAVFAR